MKPLLTFLLILSLHNCLAQNIWKPGFIVAAGDTMYGFIDERDSKSLSRECHFRSHPEADRQIFGPAELDAFGFTGDRLFISHIADGLQQPVFMEFLLKGRISLYHLKDNDSRYFAEKEGILYELKNSIQEIPQPGQIDIIRERKEYLGTLSYLMANSDITQEVYRSRLQMTSLVNLVYDYHQNVCPEEECIIFTRQKRPPRLDMGILGGMYMNSIRMNRELDSDRATGSFFGVRLEMHNGLPFIEKLNVMLDLQLCKLTDYTLTPRKGTSSILYLNSRYYYVALAPERTPFLDVNINTLALNVPLVFSWNFTLGGTFRPYAGVGLMNMIVLSQNRDFIHQVFYFNFGKTIPTYHIGPIARAGCKIKTEKSLLFLEASVHQTQNLDVYHNFYNKVFSLNAGVNF